MGLSTLTTEQFTTESSTTQAIPVTFPFAAAADLVVEDIGVVPSLRLVKNTDYSVAGGGLLNAGSYDTGAVTLIASGNHSAAGSVIRISRNTSLVQDRSYQAHGDFPAKSHEGGLDYAMMVAQDRQRMEAEFAVLIPYGAEGTNLATGANLISWVCPWLTFKVYDIAYLLATAPTGATLNLSASKNDTELYSTAPTIDIAEKTSKTAAVPAVLHAGNGFTFPLALVEGDTLAWDIDQIGSTIAGSFLQIILHGKRRISLHQPDPV